MKRFLFISLLYLMTFSVSAQKVTIKVLQTKIKGFTGWQILDGQNNTVFSGEGYLQDDTVTFSLEANKYYFLKISVSEITNRDTSLCSLILNGEPILYIKSDIGTGDHLFPFFTGIKTINAKITGGTTALISDYPWQVYYISGNFRCGGSIIGGKWIITAAHCTKNNSGGPVLASDMFIKVDVNNPSNGLEGKTYAIDSVIVNEGFDSQTLLNDIALLRLKDTINFVNATPIKLITSDDVLAGAIVPGVMSWVTGWGYTHVNPNVTPISLQKVQLPIVSTAQASTVWSSIPSTDLMAGYLNGNKDACNGDSGGPLVVPVLGEYKLAGLVSWGSTNCNTYGAYTRVSDFETWIRTKTGITRGFTPPAPTGSTLVCQGTESSQYSVQSVSGAQAYEWKLFPSSAGAISGNGPNASVLWDISYIGTITIALRVTISNKVSDWSRLDGNMVLNTALIKQSGDTTVCAGQPVTLGVTAIGYNLIYKWFKNGQEVQTGASSIFSISASTVDNTGAYKCQITGSCGIVISNTINLTVYPLTNITHISPGVEVPFGKDVILEVSADGHDLVYQWQKDGNVISNSNSSQLFLANVNATDIGIYKTTVTGTCGTKISDTIYVYVKRVNFTSEPEVFLWPSITSNEFAVALSTDSFYNVLMYNTTGRKIRELTKCQYQTVINISTLAKGVYIVEVFNGVFRKSIKIIKE
jgi:secreted trypsin-like serine protease